MEREGPAIGARIHVVGVCGTAMAAIAGLARELGFAVRGSDSGCYPPMSDLLDALGIEILQGFDAAHLDAGGAPDLVLVGNAVGRGNPEVEALLDRDLPYLSGPEFVGRHVLRGRHPVVVAGTHGKTTTSSLLAHLLACAGGEPGMLVGGVPENFGSGARLGRGPHFVIEGDEYDTAFFDKRSKFLHYRARTLVLNNLEYDHADIFPDLAAIETQFHHLVRTVPAGGHIVVNRDDDNLARVLARGCWTPQIGFAERGGREAEWQWEALAGDGGRFRLWHAGEAVIETAWSMVGRHHVANACAAAAAAQTLGVDYAAIGEALARFAGVRRRMSLVGEAGGVRVYDDFAHHPTSIRGVVAGLRAAAGREARLWVVVEPRSNTMRSRVHQRALAKSFAGADRVIFAPPAARGSRPEALLDVDALCAAIGPHAGVEPDAGAIVDYLAPRLRAGDRVLVLSNGDFDDLHRRLLARLSPEAGVVDNGGDGRAGELRV